MSLSSFTAAYLYLTFWQLGLIVRHFLGNWDKEEGCGFGSRVLSNR